MNKTGRYARVGAPQRDGDVDVVRALDPVTGLPVRVYRFEADPTPGVVAFRHPNVTRVLEAGRDDDGGYLVAEAVDGAADLTTRPGALDLPTAAAVAAALAAAHAAGIVHGDPTARRVVRRGGDVWLDGFGVPWRSAEPSDDVRSLATSLLDVPGHTMPTSAVAVLRAAAAAETASAGALAQALDDLLGPVRGDEEDEPGHGDHLRDEPSSVEPPRDAPSREDAGSRDEDFRDAPDVGPGSEPDDGPADAAPAGATAASDPRDDLVRDAPSAEQHDDPSHELDARRDDRDADTRGERSHERAAPHDAAEAGPSDDEAASVWRAAADPPDASIAPDPTPSTVVRRRVATHDVGPEPAPPRGAGTPPPAEGAGRTASPQPRPAPPRPAPPRTEPPRREPSSAEPRPSEPQRTEPQRTEPKRTEPRRTEPQRTEPRRTEPLRTEPVRTARPPHGPRSGEQAEVVARASTGVFSKTPPPDVTYRHGESPLDERQATPGRAPPATAGVRQRRRTWMLAALLLGALILAVVTAVARRPVPPPAVALGTVTSIVVDVRIEPPSLPPASLVVVASPPGSRLSAGSTLRTVPGRVVFDAEGTWQVEARFQDRRSDVVAFRLPDEREIVLRFPPLP